MRIAGPRLTVLLLAAAALGSACSGGDQLTPEELTMLKTFRVTAPLLPPDDSNVYADDPGAARLGKRFFFDTRFGGVLGPDTDGMSHGSVGRAGETEKLACVSCHDLDHGGADFRSRPVSVSLGAGYSGRNAPGVINAAFSPLWQFWDGRRDSLWSQALGPIESAVESNSSRLHLAHVIFDHYGDDFRAVFGADALPDLSDKVRFPPDGKPGDAAFDAMSGDDQRAVNRVFVDFGKAIAAYERLLISPNFTPSPLDAYLAGDETQMEPAQLRGAKLFVGRAGCAECHSGPTFSDFQFHNIGVPQQGDHVLADDEGRLTGIPQLLACEFHRGTEYSDAPMTAHLDTLWPDDPAAQQQPAGRFKTPTLRNVAKTGPYMHDGVYQNLWDVVNHYNFGGSTGRYAGERSPTVSPLLLSQSEMGDLVEFLESLSDGPPLSPDSFPDFPEGLTAAPTLP